MAYFSPSNMFSLKCSVFLFFLLASAISPCCLSGSHDSLPFQPRECVHEHFSALLQLKSSFSFDAFRYYDALLYPDLSSWNPDKRDCCAWKGITCDRVTGHVTILDLSEFYLSGEIDFQSLSQLGSLQILNLAHNVFDPSPIPSVIGQLHSLTHLNLSSLNFYGQIPKEMSNLTRLVSLDLSFNGYSEVTYWNTLKLEKGSIGALIQNMSSLRQLFLDHVDMSTGGSEWSSAISSALPNLHELSMKGCGLSGPIHPSFFHLPFLSQLDLSYNNLSFSELDFIGNLSSLTSLSLGGLLGKFPAKIWKLPHLSELDISLNNISSALLLDLIGELTSLTKLQLSGCRFHGKFPAKIWKLSHLSELDLSSNDISSPLLDFISELSSLTKLQLSYCTFHGKFPAKIWKLPHLSELDIGGSNISSALLDFIGELSSLTSLRLSYCRFHGKFPAKIWRLSHLSELDLSGSDILSSDLNFIGNISSLTWLSLSYCGLDGRYLDKILRLPFLTILDASGNDFSSINLNMVGNFSSFRSLTQLLLSDCSMSGPLPSWLGNFTRLEILYLSWNSFSGFIPSSYGTGLLNLQVINLEGNLLNGTIPSSLFSLPSLRYLILYDNQLGGQLEEFPSNASYSSSLELIDLSYNKLEGRIPRMLFCHGNCSRLEILDLSTNSFSGFIPSSLGTGLPNLKEIYLDGNLLNGMIPSSLFTLPSLRRLNLGSNQLGGQLDEFHNNASYSSSLEWIDLSGNKLQGRIPSMSGSLPSSLGNFIKLVILDLSYNNFSGKIPSSLLLLPSLRMLKLSNNQFGDQLDEFHNASSSLLNAIDLSDNMFRGRIPRSIFQLQKLEYINLLSNNFSDTINLALFLNLSKLSTLALSNINVLDEDSSNNSNSFPQLSILILSSCNIKIFPNFLRNQRSLFRLDLSNNKMNGEIPKWIWKVGNGSLTFLNLSHNALQAIGMSTFNLSMSRLSVLDLSFNVLQSFLLIPLSILSFYSVSNNNISGEISKSICNLTSLKVLDISHNKFSGLFPQCVGDISNNLVMLNLQDNAFIGSVPQTFQQDCSLRILDFSENQFQGQLSMSIANCKNLMILNAKNNKINDTFPLWIQGLPDLSILLLKSNNFHGPLKLSPNFTSKLQIFDLSSNNFTGNLPSTMFWGWKEMTSKNDSQPEYLLDFLPKIRVLKLCWLCETVKITSKSIEMGLTKIRTDITMVDLSSNHFQGPIPESIGSLKMLRGLNLSHNGFTGRIPTSLKNLTLLESLDLSKNNLFGQIPRELLDLTFLAVLNLSWNQLTGSIPYDKQFSTFTNKSFEGNLGLCGPPLSKRCESINDAPSLIAKDVETYSKSEYDWKMVGLGFGIGYGVGVGGFCWTLVLWRKGRRIYNRYLYKMIVVFFPHVL